MVVNFARNEEDIFCSRLHRKIYIVLLKASPHQHVLSLVVHEYWYRFYAKDLLHRFSDIIGNGRFK